MSGEGATDPAATRPRAAHPPAHPPAARPGAHRTPRRRTPAFAGQAGPSPHPPLDHAPPGPDPGQRSRAAAVVAGMVLWVVLVAVVVLSRPELAADLLAAAR